MTVPGLPEVAAGTTAYALPAHAIGPAPLRFVESKPPDLARLARLLEASCEANQWTNSGPVAARLEALLAERLGIHPARSVAVASSATSALFALAGVAAHRLGRPLRWLVSAYGFFSTAVGPLAGDITVLDCGDDAYLDLAAVERLPPGSWDGLIVTNVFGAAADLSPYEGVCRARGKALIADNATALFGHDRSAEDAPDEIVSLHHTKPWGFGEGGFAVLPAEDSAVFRALVNFGQGLAPWLAGFAGNGKMSDLAAAAAIARLETADDWAPAYRTQWQRVASIAGGLGFEVFSRPAPDGVSAFVALKAPGPAPGSLLAGRPLPMAKYYPPLAERPVARAIYDRIVCVASHPGLAALDDAEISGELARVHAGAIAGAPA